MKKKNLFFIWQLKVLLRDIKNLKFSFYYNDEDLQK